MTVRVCDVTFSDWVSLPMEGRYSDTFIFRISSQACLPPFVYAPLLRRIVAKIRHKRPCASLWVQVDAPGQWFAVAIHNALRGLNLPFIVTQEGETPNYAEVLPSTCALLFPSARSSGCGCKAAAELQQMN